MDKSSNSSTSRPEQKIESKKVKNPPEEHHFPCYNSGYFNDEMILSKWVPKFISYEEFMNYDHYTMDQQYQTDSSKTILPKIISSKKQKSLMMPKNHFDNQHNYYDSEIGRASCRERVC